MEEAKKCKNNNSNESQAKKSKKKLLATTTSDEVAKEEVKLAALSIHVKAKLRAADMPLTMQERALCFTRSFLDDAAALNNNNYNNRLKPRQLASALKKEFDTKYGAAWHCVVGKSFGSYVTHSNGGFLYFSFDTLFVLLFQTRVQLLTSTHD